MEIKNIQLNYEDGTSKVLDKNWFLIFGESTEFFIDNLMEDEELLSLILESISKELKEHVTVEKKKRILERIKKEERDPATV